MLAFREWISAIILFVALAGVYRLFVDIFEWSSLFFVTLCFVLAYSIWPSKRKGQREHGGWIADLFEVLIELPIDLFLWVIRLPGRLFGRKGDSIDVDFDI